jgi:hypothetical protein
MESSVLDVIVSNEVDGVSSLLMHSQETCCHRHEGTSRTPSGGPACQINQVRAPFDDCYRSHGRAARRCMRLQPLRFGPIPAYVPMIMVGSAAIVAVHASLWLVLGRSTAEGVARDRFCLSVFVHPACRISR